MSTNDQQILGDNSGWRFLLPEDQQNRECPVKRYMYACMTLYVCEHVPV